MPSTPSGAAPVKPKVHQRSNSIDSTSSHASNNSESSVLAMLEEKMRLAEHQPLPTSRSSSNGHPRPRPATAATTASAAVTRVPPNANRRVVVVRKSSTRSTSSNRQVAVRPPAPVSAAASTRPIVNPPIADVKMKMKIPTKTVPRANSASRSCSTTTCSDHDDCSNSDDSMTVLEILEEKRRLGCCPPGAATTTSGTATAVVQRRVPACREKQQKTLLKNSLLDDETLPTMPGAVFVPGISSSFYNDDSDSDMDDSNHKESDLDMPELTPGQSSGVISAAESVHLGVAVAIKVDEEEVPQVEAVPVLEEVEKKKHIPFHKTKLFCRISLILLISIIILGVATITIILLGGGDHDSDGDDGGYRETLGIRQEIEALVGTEQLESAQSPYVKALEWMIHQDPMELVPGVDSNFIQRYIMAYFYYATTTNGPWRSCNPAVGSDIEFCYLIEVNYIFELGDEKHIPATRWLSSVHECHFAGVVCNDKMQVVGLKLNGQQLSGVFPVGIVHLPFLETIKFFLGNLSGPLPKDNIGMEHLVHVNIGHNKLSGEVPIEWWRSSHFVHMNLGHNSLSGSIPPEIKDMKNVTVLNLDANNFTGTIPTEIGELNSLEKIRLSDNSLKGAIPSEFGQLEQLVELFLDRNILTGTLPPELGNMKHMLDFRVNNNNLLGGDIPESFYNMTDLYRVALSECNFTGTISPMVGNLKDMTHFVINGNSFTGTIPVELARSKDGARKSRNSDPPWRNGDIQVKNNNFQGKMPQEFCQLDLSSLIADCAPDPVTGDVELKCDCCTECFDAEGQLHSHQG